jgi:hypothetical protein
MVQERARRLSVEQAIMAEHRRTRCHDVCQELMEFAARGIGISDDDIRKARSAIEDRTADANQPPVYEDCLGRSVEHVECQQPGGELG